MDRIDALGPDPERRRVFTPELLAETDDEALQALVEQAANELGTPIALVTLVLDRIQFFKAHHGLPEDLKAARATDREVSFCQFVVRDGRPFEVANALDDPRVPQFLVREYGVLAYLGFPLKVGEEVVGSLCVIDTKARSFSQEERSALERLAGLVNERVQALAERRRQTRVILSEGVVGPAVSELRHLLSPIRSAAERGMQAAAEIRSFLRLAALTLRGDATSLGMLDRSLEMATHAADEMENLLFDIESASMDGDDCAAALEQLTVPARSTRLSDVLAAAQDLTRRNTHPSTSIVLPELAFDPVLAAPRPLAVALVASCLNELTRHLHHPRSGLTVEVQPVDAGVEMVFAARGLSAETTAGIATDLRQQMSNDPSIDVSGDDAALRLTFVLSQDEPTA